VKRAAENCRYENCFEHTIRRKIKKIEEGQAAHALRGWSDFLGNQWPLTTNIKSGAKSVNDMLIAPRYPPPLEATRAVRAVGRVKFCQRPAPATDRDEATSPLAFRS
jgi:hypothetical protein